jgi:hypothetical protein
MIFSEVKSCFWKMTKKNSYKFKLKIGQGNYLCNVCCC